jgi:hypothetical protein
MSRGARSLTRVQDHPIGDYVGEQGVPSPRRDALITKTKEWRFGYGAQNIGIGEERHVILSCTALCSDYSRLTSSMLSAAVRLPHFFVTDQSKYRSLIDRDPEFVLI